eukprot:1088610-Prorocentrum_minimum.AAC.1
MTGHTFRKSAFVKCSWAGRAVLYGPSGKLATLETVVITAAVPEMCAGLVMMMAPDDTVPLFSTHPLYRPLTPLYRPLIPLYRPLTPSIVHLPPLSFARTADEGMQHLELFGVEASEASTT